MPATEEQALRLFSALELLHACALVHDDVIDASATRRGLPTVHRLFAEKHRTSNWHGPSDQFGIVGGDPARRSRPGVGRRHRRDGGPAARGALRRVQWIWGAIRTEVLGGQYLDIVAEASGAESVASAMTVNVYKTASYTISRPLQRGITVAACMVLTCSPSSTSSGPTSASRSSFATTCSACRRPLRHRQAVGLRPAIG